VVPETSVSPVPIKRPIFRYFVLGLLLAVTVVYEFRYLRDILRGEKINVPFFATESATHTIRFAARDAVSAGVRNGDTLIAVDGVPYTGTAVLGDARGHALPGTQVVLTVRSQDHPGEQTISLPVTWNKPPFWDVVADLVLHFLLPGVCLLLGFWVAFLRPRDPMAWLLLALMLSFPHILETYKIMGWGPGWREAGMLYHATLDMIFPIAIFLFGRYFPEPFPRATRYQWMWSLQQWLLAVPFSIFAIEAVIVNMGELTNIQAVERLHRYFRPFDRVADMLVYLLIGSFFAAIGIKSGLTQTPDARRRLRLLYWGATAAFTPGLLLTFYGRIAGKPLPSLVPDWVLVLALIPLALFPLTLAYVIVVQKAMGVGVALRQGLQYALARNGVRALQILSVIAVAFAAVEILSDSAHGRLLKVTVILLGILVGLRIRTLSDRLRAWIDRRFFREAYDAEHVLSELSEQVRTMVEPSSLLETVAARISETLHVPQVAVLLGGGGLYRPVYALGYADLSDVSFPPSAGMTRMLQKQKEPARVYLNDRDSWLYRDTDVTDEERGKLARLHSELLLPLAVRAKLLGFISLGPKRSEEPYTGSDVRLLKSVAAQTGLALENANLMREIADEVAQRERLNREVEIAREVQERLFPQTLPAIAGLDYAGHCRPALGVGGDYYDFLALPLGHLGVAVGDVSGKGIAAALMMASLQASLRGEATRAPENLAVAISNINRLVYEASSANRYATFFYGQYDPVTRRFDYVNAGHNPPMLFHSANGQWTLTRLDVGGTVVGLLESFPYEQGSAALAPGDILVAYTDGISEAMNAADDEWGEDCLMRTIEGCNGLPAQEILERVFTAADAFVAGAKQHDDMTLVVLRVASE
jgi:sigma-B regulation protein RsbU (phosphoserine phosphatase)